MVILGYEVRAKEEGGGITLIENLLILLQNLGLKDATENVNYIVNVNHHF